VQVQGTSFAAPAVSGVVALMKGVNNTLNRERIIDVLEETASYQGLTLTETEQELYQSYQQARLTGEKPEERPEFLVFPEPSSAENYFFGLGLVNAEAAIQAVQ
jgi:subtilisin family serine protease